MSEKDLSIKDFTLSEAPAVQQKAKKKKRRSSVTYDVIVEDGDNFVIKRNGRPASVAVFLCTAKKPLFYIYKEDGSGEFLMDADNLNAFLKDVPDEGIELKNTSWIKRLKRGLSCCTSLMKFLDEYAPYIKTGYVRYGSGYTNSCVASFYSADHKLFKYFVEKVTDVYGFSSKDDFVSRMSLEGVPCGTRRYLESTVISPFWETKYLTSIRALYGIDNARKMIDAFVESNQNLNCDEEVLASLFGIFYPNEIGDLDLYKQKITTSYRYTRESFQTDKFNEVLASLSKQRNTEYMQFDAFLKYMLTYRIEGFKTLTSFVSTWKDVLQLQLVVYGRIVDKYPENLYSQHQKLSTKEDLVNSMEKYSADMFDDFVADAECLEWAPDWGSYIWTIPHNPGDLIDEAEQQQNCLKGYVPEVAANHIKLVFMRTKKEPDKSLLTIAVKNNGSVGEIAGFLNRPANNDEITNIKRWAKEKNLDISGI